MTPGFDFDADTRPEPAGEGRFRVTVPHHWTVETGPNGGFLAAVFVRALEASVEPPVRSLTIHYLAPPRLAPVEIAVTVLRQGRTTAFARFEASQEGTLVAAGMAALSPWREDAPAFADLAAPGHPDPDDCIRVEYGRPGQPEFLGNYDMRIARPDGDARPVALGGWIRSARPRPLDAALLAAMSDSSIPPAFVRLAPERVLCPTIDLTIHFRAPLPVDGHPWVQTRFTSTVAAGGTTDEDAWLWGPDGTLLVQARQLGVVRRVPPS